VRHEIRRAGDASLRRQETQREQAERNPARPAIARDRAALPFIGLNIVVMALMILFPDIVLWLPALMMK
jgi:hypothetical protein